MNFSCFQNKFLVYKEEELFLIAPKSAKLIKTPTGSEKKSVAFSFASTPSENMSAEVILSRTTAPFESHKDSNSHCSQQTFIAPLSVDSPNPLRSNLADLSFDDDVKKKQAEVLKLIYF